MTLGEQEPVDPLRLAVRVALIQAGLGVGLWLLLGYWNSRQTWLLDPAQQRSLTQFFLWQLPLLGAIFAVIWPAVWIYRLGDEATLAITHETEFLERILAFPRNVGVTVMVASALLFLFGAILLRFRAGAPAIEAAKVEVLGFVTGVAFGIASYFTLQPVLRPVLELGIRQGALPPSRPSFPLLQKIFVCCLAIALIVCGLFGEVALTWAEKFSEARSQEQARADVRSIADEAAVLAPRDAAAWKRLFAGSPARTAAETVAVVDSFGRLLATRPPHPTGRDQVILGSEETRESLGRLGNGSLVLRSDEVRVVSSLVLGNGWRIVALVPPDAGVIRQLLRSAALILGEVLLLSLLLAWSVGRGLTRPLRELEARTRLFAQDPEAPAEDSPPTDDEVGTVSRAFTMTQREIQRVQSRLRETERRAATAELLAGVAHEVRNPLFGITSTLAALEGELGGDHRFDPYFEIVKKEGVRLSRMMEEMLALQRAPRTPGRVLIEPLLQACADWARATFPARVERIDVSCAEGLALPNADEEGIRSVLTNLVENAALSSGRPVMVRLSGDRTPSGFVIRVEDDGSGIDSKLAQRIFEPFVSGRAGGTGMGLALCRQIVRQHGGEISSSPGPEGGTIFTISLPDLRAASV